MIQSLPDGSPLKYNHIGAAKIADTAYQGARLLDNNTALWFAGNSIDYLKFKGGSLSAIPGVEAPVMYSGKPPEWGSCLIFGDSGLPNQTGPLAPDKITFRDGWTDESRYMLVNLRFSGWHRYKATNTITMLYQGGPLVFEDTNAQPIGWLPIGRSLFRDKRIPRENLNGLIIEKQGLSSVIYQLTGITSNWAQDPPFYAYVKDFSTSPEFDFSHTVLESWHGWDHDRITYFFQDGPIIIVDRSIGPQNRRAAINWHVVGEYNEDQERINLTGGITPAEMVLLTPDTDGGKLIVDQITANENKLSIQYAIENSGNLNLVTIFLTNDWIGSDVKEVHKDGRTSLELNNSRDIITVPLDL